MYIEIINFFQKNSSKVQKQRSSMNSTVNISTNNSQVVKVETNSQTPVKTGFHLTRNSADNPSNASTLDQQKPQVNGLYSNSTPHLKKAVGISTLANEDENQSVCSNPIKLTKSSYDYQVQKEY